MTALVMIMEYRCWTKVENYLFNCLLYQNPIAEKHQELTLLSAFSSYLTRSKEEKDPENPEGRVDTEPEEVT